MDDRFGENALKDTVLTTDRHRAYFTISVTDTARKNDFSRWDAVLALV